MQYISEHISEIYSDSGLPTVLLSQTQREPNTSFIISRARIEVQNQWGMSMKKKQWGGGDKKTSHPGDAQTQN